MIWEVRFLFCFVLGFEESADSRVFYPCNRCCLCQGFDTSFPKDYFWKPVLPLGKVLMGVQHHISGLVHRFITPSMTTHVYTGKGFLRHTLEVRSAPL